MLYSAVGMLALVLNCILNSELIRNFRLCTAIKDLKRQVKLRYSHFLMAANCYFITDIVWGIAYEHLIFRGCFLYYIRLLPSIFCLCC